MPWHNRDVHMGRLDNNSVFMGGSFIKTVNHLRDTYNNLSNFYFNEANSCLESKAYRMAIVSAATSIHLKTYFLLLLEGEFNQDSRVKEFSEVEEKIKQLGKWKEVEKDLEWLRKARNAVAHPEEWIVSRIDIIPDETASNPITEKNSDRPAAARKILAASQINDLCSLSQLAKYAIDKAKKILSQLGFPAQQSSVDEIKIYLEKEVLRMTGTSLDLEKR